MDDQIQNARWERRFREALAAWRRADRDYAYAWSWFPWFRRPDPQADHECRSDHAEERRDLDGNAARYRVAEKRAEKLFRSLLTKEQLRTWDKEGYLVEGRWALHKTSRGYNSDLCWSLPYTVPYYDDLVFKLLALRTGDPDGVRYDVYNSGKYLTSLASSGPFLK